MNPLRKVLRKFGYEVIRESRQPTLRAHLKNLFLRHEIDLVLDVGANQGQFATMIRNNGYRGAIFSFEPVSASFSRLEATARTDGSWRTFRMGLGNCPGRQAINLAESSDLCSLLSPSEFGKTQFPKIEAAEQEMIEIDTIDNLLSRECIPGNTNIFLKMDTQGYDTNVFAGALNSLGRISCMLSELSLRPIYAGIPHYLQALEYYGSHGFEVSGFYPVSRKTDLTVIEMDCVLVNTSR